MITCWKMNVTAYNATKTLRRRMRTMPTTKHASLPLVDFAMYYFRVFAGVDRRERRVKIECLPG